MLYKSYKLPILLTVIAIITSCTTANNHQDKITANTYDIKAEAKTAFAQENYATAINLYQKILAAEANDQDALFYLAESWRISGNSSNAIAQYNKLLDFNKNNASALEGKGLAYLQKGDLNEAIAQLNLVIANDSSRWRSLNALGIINNIKGNDKDAAEFYEMALKIDENNPSIINNIALSVAFSGDIEKGISLLKNALSTISTTTAPNTANKKLMENNLALLYGISGQYDAAATILRKNLPEPAVYNNLGYYAKMRANKELASEFLNKAISSSPIFYEKAENNLQANTNFAATSNQTGNTPEKVKAPRGKHKLPLPMLKAN